ncbi:MAG: MerR family transcriptional regulator [Clostridium sp.]|uniref:MerR family transcriptional regulator n=1 Tax=Clostridium sp. LY3-2 TaxID=2942482 RepID=UPI002153A528|nr:MerR family transcriptional regulator [Clostridium sp. LY3-2]MCR6514337.1 MerR family transcriptional regulator [Clostridium sp. LY3-2]
MKDEMYYIGKVEKICKISKKTLRYYDKLGVLSPDEICDENGYRYYSKDNMLSIPVIKYYKQSGFKLEEIKGLIYESECTEIEENFRGKIKELEEAERLLNLKKQSIRDWHSLVKEAKMVIDNNLNEVSAKFINKTDMLYLDQEFNYDYMDSIINIDFTNYIENIENAITGPVIIKFPSFKEKLLGNSKTMRIIQQGLLKTEKEKTTEFGGGLFASCYHIGTHDNIDDTYKKVMDWIELHNYECEEECYERYVVDYWTSKDSRNFVTEVMIKIKN